MNPVKLEYETKFQVDTGKQWLVENWLDDILTPDPDHPDSIISSLYFDSVHLNAYWEKINGDYRKSKFRVRWYQNAAGTESKTPVTVVQAKHSIGSRRYKETRAAEPIPECLLGTSPDIFRASNYQKNLFRLDTPPRTAVFPVVLVRYRRKRYIANTIQSSICLDTRLEAPCFNHQLFSNVRSVKISDAILEIKGGNAMPPPEIHSLLETCCRKTAFSKYAKFIDFLSTH